MNAGYVYALLSFGFYLGYRWRTIRSEPADDFICQILMPLLGCFFVLVGLLSP